MFWNNCFFYNTKIWEITVTALGKNGQIAGAFTTKIDSLIIRRNKHTAKAPVLKYKDGRLFYKLILPPIAGSLRLSPAFANFSATSSLLILITGKLS